MDFRESIAAQPQSLAASREAVEAALAQMDPAPLARGAIGLVGMGASLYAAIAGAAVLRGLGRRAWAVCASDLLDAAADAGDALIALSASGRSRETVEAVRLRPAVPAYAISRDATNPLAAVAERVIAMASGDDASPCTTSYVATLQALGLLIERMQGVFGNAVWRRLPEQVAAVAALSAEAARMLADCTAADFVGAGAAFGTAGEAALLAREAGRFFAASWETRNYLHGPMEPLGSGKGVVVFGDGREVKLAEDVAAFGCPTILVTGRDGAVGARNLLVLRVPATGNVLADAVLQIVPMQLLAAELAAAAGIAAGSFRHRQADTKIPSA
jgi:glucosamine--fructose-6-phosphate aminotransferase (isomerizing)